MSAREDAKSTLIYYLNRALGEPLTSDMTAEIEGIVDNVIDAAVEDVFGRVENEIKKQMAADG